MNREFNKFDASLHTHVRSKFDAHIKPNDLVKRIKELGGKGIAITDHGVLSSIEDYKPAFAENNLKMIPGVELYVDGGILGRLHLVLLAKNDHGYKGICKIVTESNNNLTYGFPVIPKEKLFEMMKDYKGDIFALSACMQGVICALFLLNGKVDIKIAKLRKEQKSLIAPGSVKDVTAKDVVNGCMYTYEDAIAERDKCKQYAEMKFTRRLQVIDKKKKSGEDVSALLAELEADQKKHEEAVIRLSELKDAVAKANKSLKNAKKNLETVTESVCKYNEIEKEIEALNKEKSSDEELYSLARKEALLYADAFGIDSFYIELQNHGIAEEKTCYPKVAKLSKELHIPVVATNDVHILLNSEDEVIKRSIMMSMRFKDTYIEPEDSDREMYLKDNYELAKALDEILPEDIVTEAINNISVIFDACNVEFKTEKHYPKFSQTGDANKILEEEVKKGIAWRFPNGMDKEHEERVKYELQIIESMGYADYHLIVKDFLEYGRLLGYVPKELIDEAPLTIPELKDYIEKHGWKNGGCTIGPGRGSAAGSLVCYVLGITNLDPIVFGLLFERFLNPERISMPDIDSDIANYIRPKVIEYVKNKYGVMAVCGIMTITKEAPKGAIQDASKYYALKKYGDTRLSALDSAIRKSVPEDLNISFSTLVDETGKTTEDGSGIPLSKYLNEKFADNSDALEIIRWAVILEGTFKTYSAHAAGIVISDNDDISDYLPLMYNSDLGSFTTQCDMVQVEELGLLKFDFLGLRTLDVITDCLKAIERNHGIIIDPLKIDLNDSNVYHYIFSEGKTVSIFQVESDGMKSMLKRFRPTTFEDLIILISMYRPGPLQYLDEVIDVKNQVKPMTFLCPQLESILGKTYGAIVYQEQVMQICQTLAGYTLGGADVVRRYMSKKKADKLAHERETFVSGCESNSINSNIANTLFDQMMDFASYAFNKSHAAVYAFVAFVTAYLKYYYTAEFMAAVLINNEENKKMAGLIYETIENGVHVLAPDINTSDMIFSVVNNEIRFGLNDISGVDTKSAAKIIAYRKEYGSFNSLIDFVKNIKLGEKAYEKLVCAGALDCFSNNRQALKDYICETSPIADKMREKASFIASAEYVLEFVETKTVEEIVDMQKEANLKVEISEKTTVAKLEKQIATAKNTLSELTKSLTMIKLHDPAENKTKRMELEKECLKVYVTDHPINYYPKAAELGCNIINEITEDDKVCYGLITNLSIKKRKKDGAEMAFFTIEDMSGSIDVCLFVDAYKKNKDKVANGNVVKLYGDVNVEEFNEEIEMKFFAKTVETQRPKDPALVMKVPSYASFHLDIEDDFISEYSNRNSNRTFLIYDSALNEIREMTYKVNDEVIHLPNVEELNL